jgi:hypothetical protein
MALTPEVRTTEGNVLVATPAPISVEQRVTEANILTAINIPAVGERVTQANGIVVAVPSTTLRTTETNILVAVLRGAEERLIRAWTFTQDDHDFYVLLAASETYIYDKLTDQWCSPDASGYWRGIDGCDWNGVNVCIDPDSGKLYQIDPTGRLDYHTTPITSVVYGGLTERFRDIKSCFMAEVAISQAQPPLGIDGTTVNITLDSYDTITWTNHGSVSGVPIGSRMYPRYYGLGLISSPGRLFRITDTGYARRIDGLNLSVSGEPQ